MIRNAPRRIDVSLTPRNLAAALVACALAAVAVAAEHRARPLPVGYELPVWGARNAAATERINPNTASAGSLQRLPGIGPVRAAAIVAYRQDHGPTPFARPADLANVHGIGAGIVRNIAHHLKFDASTQPHSPLNPPPPGP